MTDHNPEKSTATTAYNPDLPPPNNSELPPTLLPLLDKIAESVHDAWAAQRISDGWRWGPKRDDDEKTNPTIRPYKDLPESEKLYDRQTAATTLRAIINLGYSISEGEHTTAPQKSASDELARLSAHRQTAGQLIRIWEAHSIKVWRSNPKCYVTAAELLCRHGEAFAAFDVCREGLTLFPGNLRLRQLEAWALAQGGAFAHARERLTSLCSEAHESSAESWSLLARTWKDLAFLEPTGGARDAALREALDAYTKALASTTGEPQAAYYPAINCATVCQLLGDSTRAHEYARIAMQSATSAHPNDPWATATLGEAWLLLGDFERARQYYQSFATACRHETAVLASARKQARRILQSRLQDARGIDQLLPFDPVLRIATAPPPECTTIPMAVFTLIAPYGVEVVERILEYSGSLRLILPLNPEFMPRSILPEPAIINRWQEGGADVTIAHPGARQLSEELVTYCRLLELGMTKDWADTLATEWRDLGPHRDPSAQEMPDKPTPEPQVFAFADVAGYGGLDEDRVRTFQTRIIPELHDFLNRQTDAPRFCETWGDALFIGFSNLRSAARISLGLQSFFTRYPWQENGFIQPLRLRIGLHCGPALVVFNPFLGRHTFTGSQVSRAARIEPVADEGQVFCSRAFQLCCRALDINEFTFVYAGEFRLPKNSGREKIYRLLAM